MADEITVYTLTVKEARKNTKTQKPEDLGIKTSSDTKDYQIKSLSYEKRLYSPCCINVELKTTLELSEIQNDFGGGKSVTLQVQNTTIATDYFIYQYKPVFANSECSVFLTLFSRDKLLTLDKFNKVYLNKQLGKGIIKEMLDSTKGLLKDCKVTFDVKNNLDNTTEFDAQRLQVLSYKKDTGQKDKNGNPVFIYQEVIQPYRVQYNEDFYSFISRIACRCGEFLYFEDGKLKLGLDTGGTAIDISGAILSKEYPAFGCSSRTVTSCYRNYLSAYTDNNFWSTASLPCSDYGAFDEYFDVLDGAKLPDKASDEFYWPDVAESAKCAVFPFVGRLAWGHELFTTAAKFVFVAADLAAMITSWKRNSDSVNNKFINSFITPNPPIAAQQKSGNKVSQFADVEAKMYGKLLNTQLAEIRDKEMRAATSIVHVQVKTKFAAEKKIKLGSIVSITEGKDKKAKTVNYRVVSCTGQYFDTQSEITDITAFDLVPAQQITISDCGTTPVSRYIPPYDKCAESVPASPQIAIVKADNDPRYLGRVRVRYTWQNSSEAGSPWVRVLTPLASSSGAVHFQPKAGDEVLLGYIDGNIDRPYVAGSLFNDKDKIHDCLYSQYNDTIRVGSQRLDFRPGLITNWINSVLPFAGMVTPFLTGKMVELTNLFDEHLQKAEEFHGITRLTDTNSIWKIEGDTAARSITIKSAWGKVTINAYTGIKIESAGDISIKGKNISISAQNNINIESGVAIKNARKSTKLFKGDTSSWFQEWGATLISDLAFKSTDLSLIRTFWESIIPPKEGTLKIKSNRYLALEAGEGKAFDNEIVGVEATDPRFVARFDSAKGAYKGIVNDINSIHDAVEKYYKIHKIKKYEVANFRNDYIQLITSMQNQLGQLQDVDTFLHDVGTCHYSKTELRDYQTIVHQLTGNDSAKISMAYSWLSFMDRWLPTLKIADDTLPQIFTGSLADKNDTIKGFYFKVDGSPLDRNDENYKDKNAAFQNIVKTYLSGIDTLKVQENAANWQTYVNAIDTKESKVKAFFEGVGAKIISGLDLATDAEYERVYRDNDSKKLAKGRILMSEDEKKSIHLRGATLVETYNESIKSVKEALLRPFEPDEAPQAE